MRYYAVIDTNVLVSALLNERSAPGEILRKVAEEIVVPLYCADIIEEYEDVLHRAKFSFSAERSEALIDNLLRRGVNLETNRTDFDVSDSDDVVFYAVVMEKRQDADAYLITGNKKHFPAEPFVVTPREMLDMIESSESV